MPKESGALRCLDGIMSFPETMVLIGSSRPSGGMPPEPSMTERAAITGSSSRSSVRGSTLEPSLPDHHGSGLPSFLLLTLP